MAAGLGTRSQAGVAIKPGLDNYMSRPYRAGVLHPGAGQKKGQSGRSHGRCQVHGAGVVGDEQLKPFQIRCQQGRGSPAGQWAGGPWGQLLRNRLHQRCFLGTPEDEKMAGMAPEEGPGGADK